MKTFNIPKNFYFLFIMFSFTSQIFTVLFFNMPVFIKVSS